MISLVGFELSKLFRKWRTYIGFLAIGLLVPIVQIVLYYEGDHFVDRALRSVQQTFMFDGDLLNGYLIGYIILQALLIHIPFLIVLVGGDILAGEATAGTYRMLLIRPVSRFKVITSKFIAGIIYTNMLLAFLAFMSLVVSLIVFGAGELIVFENILYIFASDDVFWRFGMAYGYAALSMSTVFALSFLFSSLVENAIGPIVATMAIIIIFAILSALNFDALKVIHPYLFTNYIADWRLFFRDPVDITEIVNSAVVLIGHITGLYLITLYLFIKKDILS